MRLLIRIIKGNDQQMTMQEFVKTKSLYSFMRIRFEIQNNSPTIWTEISN